MTEPLDEIWKLRGCISDLVSLMALPALWRGGEPAAVSNVLSDVLLRMLRLDFIYIHLALPGGSAPLETVRLAAPAGAAGSGTAALPAGAVAAAGSHAVAGASRADYAGARDALAEAGVAERGVAGDATAVGRALAPWLTDDAALSSITVPNPVGSGETTIAVAGLGLEERGVVVAGSQRAGFPTYMETLLLRVAVNQALTELQRAEVLAQRRRCSELERSQQCVQAHNRYLRGELDGQQPWESVISHGEGLKRVRALIEQVAPTSTCVLLLGEAGSGKEQAARAIHHHSDRREQPFIRFDCAAVPPAALEGRLFGRAAGAANGGGAVEPQLGCFDLAHGGTLFLDEIGALPQELQARVLRVLQDQEFDRPGGSGAAVRCDVRLVAASSRDLKALVAEHRFRGDLCYRLTVFPIELPPLRDRVDDLAQLVRHYAQLHARRNGKQITTIAPQTMAALRRYAWPGNLRELDNLIERSVMLSPGPLLDVPLADLAAGDGQSGPSALPKYVTLEDAQREHIVRALAASNWVIAGAAGAAAKLGMKRTSLQYKMHKLGITRPQ
jgi:DNA-binding NtrC family response regulator